MGDVKTGIDLGVREQAARRFGHAGIPENKLVVCLVVASAKLRRASHALIAITVVRHR